MSSSSICNCIRIALSSSFCSRACLSRNIGSNVIRNARHLTSSSAHEAASQGQDRRRTSGGNRYEKKEMNLEEEIQRYEIGKRWLARMMGEDPENFTNEDIERSLTYLLPSGLFAKDARPVMKHPKDLFPEKKDSIFDADGRPASPGYFTGQPKYHDLIYSIYEKTEELDAALVGKSKSQLPRSTGPTVDADDDVSQEIARWVDKTEMEAILLEKVSEKQLSVILFRLKRLAKHPLADVADEFLRRFQRPVIQANINLQHGEVDEEGRGHAIGYRKTSIAEIWISEGNGKVTVNDRPFIDYFPNLEDRQQIMFPLIVVDKLRQYDLVANTIGGGLAGQAGAIRLAVSRAFAAVSETHEKALLKENLLIRDPRRVERKKPGQKKARKKFAWVKR